MVIVPVSLSPSSFSFSVTSRLLLPVVHFQVPLGSSARAMPAIATIANTIGATRSRFISSPLHQRMTRTSARPCDEATSRLRRIVAAGQPTLNDRVWKSSNCVRSMRHGTAGAECGGDESGLGNLLLGGGRFIGDAAIDIDEVGELSRHGDRCGD